MNDLESLAYDVITGYIMAYHRDGLLRPFSDMENIEVLTIIANIKLDAKEQLGGTLDDATIGQLVEVLFDRYCNVHNLF